MRIDKGNPGRIVGRCYMCNLPVLAQVATRILDPPASVAFHRNIRRLAHAGRCELELRHRLGA